MGFERGQEDDAESKCNKEIKDSSIALRNEHYTDSRR
jgi:hypothetical protein